MSKGERQASAGYPHPSLESLKWAFFLKLFQALSWTTISSHLGRSDKQVLKDLWIHPLPCHKMKMTARLFSFPLLPPPSSLSV
jgi:hypothetical protein